MGIFYTVFSMWLTTISHQLSFYYISVLLYFATTTLAIASFLGCLWFFLRMFVILMLQATVFVFLALYFVDFFISQFLVSCVFVTGFFEPPKWLLLGFTDFFQLFQQPPLMYRLLAELTTVKND